MLDLEDHGVVLILHEAGAGGLGLFLVPLDELLVGLDQRVVASLVLGLDVVDEASVLDVRVEARDHAQIVSPGGCQGNPRNRFRVMLIAGMHPAEDGGPEPRDDGPVPLFGTWRAIYTAVIVTAVVVMGLLVLFSGWPW